MDDRTRWSGSLGAALLTLAVASALSVGASPALAATPVNPLISSARLVGKFSLAGRITVASNVPGEQRGQSVLRTWVFSPRCGTGVCKQIRLLRYRANGTDQVLLKRSGDGTYTGSSSFYAPLRCGTRTIARGALVPFTVTVTITAAAPSDFGPLATRVNATYTNRSRRNLTGCVAVLGHDAARYHGHMVPADTGGGGLSGRSPAGS